MQMTADGKPLHIILQEVMEEHGLKMTTWPTRAGLANGTLKAYFRKIENGEDASLTYRVLEKLAAVIGMSATEMLGADRTATEVPIVGYVQAGDFAEEQLLERDRYVSLPDNLHGQDGITALEVRGDSMDRMLPAGSVIFAREINMHIEQGYEIKSGMLVVAVREKDDQREYTVKQLEQKEDGSLILHPRSTNAVHRPIHYLPGADFVHGKDLQNEEYKVELRGIVCGAHVSYI